MWRFFVDVVRHSPEALASAFRSPAGLHAGIVPARQIDFAAVRIAEPSAPTPRNCHKILVTLK